mmetsp:Transcript_48486/g.90878  ORF Transcript_48486/g.90878 Transcript_48486/m.90878 type:complete len:275 (-) Transcript_48486:16-840(-)
MEPLDSFAWRHGAFEEKLIFWLCIALILNFILAAVVLSSGVEAPYGRYHSSGAQRGRLIELLASFDVNAKLAWILQECPTLIAAAACWASGDKVCTASLGNMCVLLCFVLHYVNRSVVYPLRMKGSKPVPLPIMLMAMMFCAANGYIQCRSLTRYLLIPMSPRTLAGIAVWATGLYINVDADHRLRNLRKPGDSGYKIPHGGMFDYVSGANFFGEIVEWIGFAIAMHFSLPGLMFAFCTACNIGPRAIAHHHWYLQKFKDQYPKDRKALVPFVL